MIACIDFQIFKLSYFPIKTGGLAQLARAPALHAGGQRFESVILHQTKAPAPEGEQDSANGFTMISSLKISILSNQQIS